MAPGGNVAQRQSGRFISARSLVRAQSLPLPPNTKQGLLEAHYHLCYHFRRLCLFLSLPIPADIPESFAFSDFLLIGPGLLGESLLSAVGMIPGGRSPWYEFLASQTGPLRSPFPLTPCQVQAQTAAASLRFPFRRYENLAVNAGPGWSLGAACALGLGLGLGLGFPRQQASDYRRRDIRGLESAPWCPGKDCRSSVGSPAVYPTFRASRSRKRPRPPTSETP